YRAQCEPRGVQLAFALIDIDEFKRKFNEPYTEVRVDQDVLPHFLAAVEGHVFCHGHAYHEGGDEFIVLTPSVTREAAVFFLNEPRAKLAALKYRGIDQTTTVSVGLCVVGPDCPLTDLELKERANLAKKHAKVSGRNLIATFKGGRMTPEELEVVAA